MGKPFWNKLLVVNLTTKECSIKEISDNDYKKYLGGSGIAAKLLLEEYDITLDPLHPDSPIMIFPGLLTGTSAPTACKTSMCSKSPQTGIWNEATVGGFWGAELKFAGWDGIIVKGKSEKPSYIFVNDDEVQLKDAQHLWGLDTYLAEEKLQEETNPKARVAAIGPAGEKLMHMAAVIIEGRDSRAAGRGGIGTAWGAKNLKAIAVKGSKKLEVFDKEGLLSYIKTNMPMLKEKAKGLTDFGTAGGVVTVESRGDLPVKNWLGGAWKEGAAKTNNQTMMAKYFLKHYGCYACPIRCGKDIEIKDGPYGYIKGHGAEYETAAGFGALCENTDIDHLLGANDLCNKYGLDTISASTAVAWAIEAFEKGLITTDDTDGAVLSWGEGAAMVEVLKQIIEQRGIGPLIANGVMDASKKLGKNSEEFAIHVKGMEIAMHDPRAFTSMAINYATANRGGCHLEALSYFIESGTPLPELGYTPDNPFNPYSSDRKADLAFNMQNLMNAFNALGICKFVMRASMGPQFLADILTLSTGWEFDTKELMEAGERLFNLKRLYNAKLGISRKDDVLPPRLFTWARPDGTAAGVVPHLGLMLAEYYVKRGWTEDGIPTQEKLEELGIYEVNRSSQ